MPPKPRPVFSTTDATTKDAMESKLMPPPPPPNPPTSRVILEPEANALANCLKNAAIKTGQIYSFFADTHRLGIQAHAPKPPRSLTASLGREIEKYDQIVDAMEAQLNRAIAVLQRDLEREELRIKQAADATLAAKSGSFSPTSKDIPVPPMEGTPKQDAAPLPTPSTSPRPSSSAGPSRRPSAISISSLHRPVVPLKLDLSSSALRLNPEEAAAMFSSGLASPVTLAPKSARPIGPNEFPPELMAAFVASNPSLNERPVDIDLTIGEQDPAPITTTEGKLADVGSSADKPIELDLDSMDIDMDMDMTDLFGDAAESGTTSASEKDAMNDLFSANVGPLGESSNSVKAEAFDTNNTDDLFASLGVTGGSQDVQPMKDGNSDAQTAPSPNTLLASFAAGDAAFNTADQNSNPGAFDINNLDFGSLSPSFFNAAGDSDMKFMDMDFLSVGAGGPSEELTVEKKAEETS